MGVVGNLQALEKKSRTGFEVFNFLQRFDEVDLWSCFGVEYDTTL
jgi:hypothetical protein